MAQSLVIFDYSGSMAGERCNKCRQACSNFTDPYELWLFGSDVQEKGLIRSLPQFECNSGTSITLMLDKLHAWMSHNINKYVYILTDGEDTYDEVSFTTRFNQIKNRNHQVTVFDIGGKNLQSLKNIFANFGIRVTTTYEEITGLVQNLQAVMLKDKEIIQSVASINEHLQELMDNMQKLQKGSEDLKKKSNEMRIKSENTTNNAKQAHLVGNVQKLDTVSEELKVHVKELAEHINKLKKNEREAKKLQLQADEIQDDIEELETKIKAEENSPLAHQQKLADYQTDVVKKKNDHAKLTTKLQVIEKESATQIKEFKTLENKVTELQIKITESVKLAA